jgi:hypothetical protein
MRRMRRWMLRNAPPIGSAVAQNKCGQCYEVVRTRYGYRGTLAPCAFANRAIHSAIFRCAWTGPRAE